MLERLPAKEALIMDARMGFETEVPRTLEDLGEEFGLTRERIRQQEMMALKRLRKMPEAKELRW